MKLIKRLAAICMAILITATLIPAQAEESFKRTVRIMNCDTGRTIGSEAGDEFIYTANGDEFTLSDVNGKYIDLTAESPEVSSASLSYRRVDIGNRSQIILPDGEILCDTGEGSECYAVLRGLKDSDRIYTGWYITDADMQAPLKILPVGDSLTQGVNPDSKNWVSYREELSAAMLEYFGQVCFVGNNAEATAVTDNMLLRHSGYGGYVFDNVYHLEQTPGMAPLIDDMMKKFTPDIVLLMLGTNDCAFMNGTTDSKGEVEKLLGRWEEFTLNIEAQLPENGIVICMSVPPIPENPGVEKRIEYFNELLEVRIAELADEGCKIGYADTFSAVNADTYMNISSDGVHLSISGYSAEAVLLDGVLKQVYSADGKKIGSALPAPLNSEEESVVSKSDNSSATAKDSSPYTLVIIIVCAAVVVVAACITVLIIVLRKNKQ